MRKAYIHDKTFMSAEVLSDLPRLLAAAQLRIKDTGYTPGTHYLTFFGPGWVENMPCLMVFTDQAELDFVMVSAPCRGIKDAITWVKANNLHLEFLDHEPFIGGGDDYYPENTAAKVWIKPIGVTAGGLDRDHPDQPKNIHPERSASAVTGSFAGAICPRCGAPNNHHDDRPTPPIQLKRYSGRQLCDACKDYFEGKEVGCD